MTKTAARKRKDKLDEIAKNISLLQDELRSKDKSIVKEDPTRLIQRDGRFFSRMKKEELLEYNWSGIKVRGLQLQKMDLSGLDFSGSTLIDAEFDGSDLTGADFTGAILQNSSFVKSILNSADFTGADLSSADFGRINFNRRTKFDGVTLSPSTIFSFSSLAELEKVGLPDKNISLEFKSEGDYELVTRELFEIKTTKHLMYLKEKIRDLQRKYDFEVAKGQLASAYFSSLSKLKEDIESLRVFKEKYDSTLFTGEDFKTLRLLETKIKEIETQNKINRKIKELKRDLGRLGGDPQEVAVLEENILNEIEGFSLLRDALKERDKGKALDIYKRYDLKKIEENKAKDSLSEDEIEKLKAKMKKKLPKHILSEISQRVEDVDSVLKKLKVLEERKGEILEILNPEPEFVNLGTIQKIIERVSANERRTPKKNKLTKEDLKRLNRELGLIEDRIRDNDPDLLQAKIKRLKMNSDENREKITKELKRELPKFKFIQKANFPDSMSNIEILRDHVNKLFEKYTSKSWKDYLPSFFRR
jgi:uncharacterized protein YjbI with pentapeptide repeats